MLGMIEDYDLPYSAHTVPTVILENAACAGMDSRIWGLDDEDTRVSQEESEQAALVCATCPVRVACGAHGKAHNEYGMWGGEYDMNFFRKSGPEWVSPFMVKRPPRKVLVAPIKRKTCGTQAGYNHHRKWNEDACTPCRAASRAHSVEYRKRKKIQAAQEKENSNVG